MTELATAWVQIVPSTRGMKGALEKELVPEAESAGDKAGEKAGKGFGSAFEKNTGKSLKDFGKTALIGAAALGVGLVGVANAAGNLDAALAANKQVLGQASAAVQTWAKDSVKNVGLSERAVLQATTAFGQLGKVAGLSGNQLSAFSIDMVTMAADLAAFADVPASQAVDDLRAAFAGSTETMQKYNIFLNETELKSALYKATGEKVTGVLTAQQRVLATHAALMAQTGDIQGQAAREAGGWQRAQDNLKATLEDTAASVGSSVLPALTGLLAGITSGIGLFGDLNEATSGLVGGLLLVGTLGLGAAGSVAMVTSKVAGAVEAFGEMSKAAQRASLAVGLVAAVAVAGFMVWDSWRKKQEAIRARTEEVSGALQNQFWETQRLARETAGLTGDVNGLAVAQDALSKALTSTGDDGRKLTEALGALKRPAADAAEVLVNLGKDPVDALRDLALGAGLTADQADKLAGIVDSTDDKFTILTQTATQLGEEFVPVAMAMEEIQDQAEKTDLKALAESFLNTTTAASGLSEEGQKLAASLVDQAKEFATAADGTYDAVAAYDEFARLAGALTPKQLALLDSTAALGSAMGDAADEGAGLNTVAGSSIKIMSQAESAFEAAADQASAFSDALDRLIGVNINMQAASDALTAGFDELANIVAEATAGTDGFSLSLDASTEEGRKNREQIRQSADQILTYSKGMLDAGHSIDEASDAALWNTGVLRGQLTQFGLTEQEADAYIATLGLTPENISTAVELYNDEAVKIRVEELIDRLDEIPETEATTIEALIANEQYDEAERRLNNLARPRNAQITLTAEGRVNYGGGVLRSAAGRYIDRPALSTLAEEGAEAVLPLTDPNRMRALMADSRILNPILAALPRIDVTDRRGSSAAGSVTGLRVDHMEIHDGTDVQTVARIINYELAGAV